MKQFIHTSVSSTVLNLAIYQVVEHNRSKEKAIGVGETKSL